MRRSSFAILWVVLSMLVLGSLYWGLRISLSGHEVSTAESRTYQISISAARPGEEFPVFKVTQGDIVTLLIHSDRPGEVHVHAYDEKISTLKPGGEVRMTFAAKDVGRFPVHLHDPDGSMRYLATLEVQPR